MSASWPFFSRSSKMREKANWLAVGGLPPMMRLTVIAITVLPVGVGVLTNLPPAAS
jgi:hypothetical protein